jgi:two-component system cell cycle response regulator
MPVQILVVDDEPGNLELMQAMLAPEGYEVLLAGRSEEGLAAAHERKPDLIILDLMMPRISGFEVCARLKTDPQTWGIPVLFVTGLTSVGDKERALAAGGDEFLSKPILRAELLACVEALLMMRHVNRDLDRALASLHEVEGARPALGLKDAPGPVAPEAGTTAILVVDNDPAARQRYANLFREVGGVIHEAEKGSVALEIAKQECIDLVLLDVALPDMSGLDVLARLGELIPDSPVIVVAAHPTSENTRAALGLGAFDFLVKTVENKAVLAAVSGALERRRHAVRSRRLIQQAEAKTQELLALLREQAEESGRMLRVRRGKDGGSPDPVAAPEGE